MIICCGEALIDMVRAPIPGSKEGFLPLPGGSPYNTAIAIGKLGAPVKFLGRFSTDFFGEALSKRLRENNVGEDLTVRSGQNTALAFVKPEKGKEPHYIFYTENTADRSLSVEDLPAKLPADTRCILFGSISMTMEPIASAIEALIMREGTRKSADQMDGAPVISFDPNIRPFMIKDRNAYIERFERWIAESTIAKISSLDFGFIYPKLNPEQALHKILAMGPRLAICTLGPKGALALLRRNDGNVTKVSAPTVNLPVVNTIGAGDTFHGAFLAWLELNGKMSRSALAGLSETDLYDALFFANKAASIVCSRKGTEPPSRKEVDTLKLPQAKTSAKKPAGAGSRTGASKAKAPVGKAQALKSKPAVKPRAKAAAKPKAAAPKKPAAKVPAKPAAAKPRASPAKKNAKKK